jgi:hypothetical protein
MWKRSALSVATNCSVAQMLVDVVADFVVVHLRKRKIVTMMLARNQDEGL